MSAAVSEAIKTYEAGSVTLDVKIPSSLNRTRDRPDPIRLAFEQWLLSNPLA